MQWDDEALVIGCKSHGEQHLLLEAFTKEQGRHLGLVRRDAQARILSYLQPGNTIFVHWRARLIDQLGYYRVEPITLRTSHLLNNNLSLYTTKYICDLLHIMEERDRHISLYLYLSDFFNRLTEPTWSLVDLIYFELFFLQEMGFGLDLTCCAITGQKHDLHYISPKTGQAVSHVIGLNYRRHLLPLPPVFFKKEPKTGSFSCEEILLALRVTSYFIQRNLFVARGLNIPASRTRLLTLLSTSNDHKNEGHIPCPNHNIFEE